MHPPYPLDVPMGWSDVVGQHVAAQLPLAQDPDMLNVSPSQMRRRLVGQVDNGRLEVAIATARERVQSETPFSPSWDAAMAALEDLERQVWRIEERGAVAR
jgi:hypothetical protein